MLFVIITTIWFFKYIGIQSVQMLPGSQSAVTKNNAGRLKMGMCPSQNALLDYAAEAIAFLI